MSLKHQQELQDRDLIILSLHETLIDMTDLLKPHLNFSQKMKVDKMLKIINNTVNPPKK